jgi:hypothetical protein
MEATLNVNISLSINQLADMIRQLPKRERSKLDTLLQEEAEPSKEQILSQLKDDYIALQKGTLKTRPAKEFLAELKQEGYL